MIYPYYFTDRSELLKMGFRINVDTHHINHAKCNLTLTPNYPEFGNEVRYINKIIKELSGNYARLVNQFKLKITNNFFSKIW